MMYNCRIYIAAAGAGKTTLLINEAIKLNDKSILITTFTNANADSIRNKIKDKIGYIPYNIKVQTWFSFLLSECIRPYQSPIFKDRIEGIIQVNGMSQRGVSRQSPRYFVNKDNKIYSDKISDCVMFLEEKKPGLIFDRIKRIYDYIFIDEMQDYAGYDFEVIKSIIESKVKVVMVGDPRQTTYKTHNAKKNKKYNNGKFVDFFKAKCKNTNILIDKSTLNCSYRNNQKICDFASLIANDGTMIKSNNNTENHHEGIFLIPKDKVSIYLEKYNPVQLRYNRSRECDERFPVYNFGESKGLEFDRVLIYPTIPYSRWIINNKEELSNRSRAQFYVAVTRAKHSVGIVCDEEMVKHDHLRPYLLPDNISN